MTSATTPTTLIYWLAMMMMMMTISSKDPNNSNAYYDVDKKKTKKKHKKITTSGKCWDRTNAYLSTSQPTNRSTSRPTNQLVVWLYWHKKHLDLFIHSVVAKPKQPVNPSKSLTLKTFGTLIYTLLFSNILRFSYCFSKISLIYYLGGL